MKYRIEIWLFNPRKEDEIFTHRCVFGEQIESSNPKSAAIAASNKCKVWDKASSEDEIQFFVTNGAGAWRFVANSSRRMLVKMK